MMTFLGKSVSSDEAVCLIPQGSAKSLTEGQLVFRQCLVQSLHRSSTRATDTTEPVWLRSRATHCHCQCRSSSELHYSQCGCRLLLTSMLLLLLGGCSCSAPPSPSIFTSSTLHHCCRNLGTTDKNKTPLHTAFVCQRNQNANAAWHN